MLTRSNCFTKVINIEYDSEDQNKLKEEYIFKTKI